MGWIARKRQWAAQNPLFWSNLGLIGVCLALIWIWPAPAGSDFRVKTLGMVLQIVGVLTVWWDLTATARDLGKAGMFSRTWRWLKAGFGVPTIHAAAGILEGGYSVASGRGSVRTALDPERPVEMRLAALEAYVRQIDSALDGAFREIDSKTAELANQIKAESSERSRMVAELRSKMESATVGNHSVLVFGAWWLGVGIVLATWAPEIARTVAGQWQAVVQSL